MMWKLAGKPDCHYPEFAELNSEFQNNFFINNSDFPDITQKHWRLAEAWCVLIHSIPN